MTKPKEWTALTSQGLAVYSRLDNVYGKMRAKFLSCQICAWERNASAGRIRKDFHGVCTLLPSIFPWSFCSTGVSQSFWGKRELIPLRKNTAWKIAFSFYRTQSIVCWFLQPRMALQHCYFRGMLCLCDLPSAVVLCCYVQRLTAGVFRSKLVPAFHSGVK